MKTILMVQHEDGSQEAICPNCKSKMTYRDLGCAPSITAGEYDNHDYGGFWECQNTDCGYQSDEEKE